MANLIVKYIDTDTGTQYDSIQEANLSIFIDEKQTEVGIYLDKRERCQVAKLITDYFYLDPKSRTCPIESTDVDKAIEELTSPIKDDVLLEDL